MKKLLLYLFLFSSLNFNISSQKEILHIFSRYDVTLSWIPFKEKLPPFNKWVLVGFWDNRDNLIYYIARYVKINELYIRFEYAYTTEESKDKYNNITYLLTHWLDIPDKLNKIN